MGGGGLGNLGNARKKTFFFQLMSSLRSFQNWIKSWKHCLPLDPRKESHSHSLSFFISPIPSKLGSNLTILCRIYHNSAFPPCFTVTQYLLRAKNNTESHVCLPQSLFLADRSTLADDSQITALATERRGKWKCIGVKGKVLRFQSFQIFVCSLTPPIYQLFLKKLMGFLWELSVCSLCPR